MEFKVREISARWSRKSVQEVESELLEKSRCKK